MKDTNAGSSSAEWESHPGIYAFFVLWVLISWLLYSASTADRKLAWLVMSVIIVVIAIVVGAVVTSKVAATKLHVSKPSWPLQSSGVHPLLHGYSHCFTLDSGQFQEILDNVSQTGMPCILPSGYLLPREPAGLRLFPKSPGYW